VAAVCLVGQNASAAGVVSITPHTLQNNTALAALKSVTPVVSGGATTVPTDATRVQFAVTVTGKANGELQVFANGAAGLGVDSVPMTANVTVSTTVTESVGLQNKVAFRNNSTNSLSLTVKIIGFTTEVRASDVSGAGGHAGQVLTNTGSGAVWQDGGRAAQRAPANSAFLPSGVVVTVASLTVQPGSYFVSFSALFTTNSTTPDILTCQLLSPTGHMAGSNETSTDLNLGNRSSISLQGLVSVAVAGTVTVSCHSNTTSAASVSDMSLIALLEGSVTGDVTS
jgi:hypothetical protein